MKKTITFLKTMLLAVLLLVGSGSVWAAQGDVAYTLNLSNKSYSSQSYLSTWDWTSNSIVWSLNGAANNNGGWAYVRFGGKSNTSGLSYVASKSYISVPIQKVTMNVLALGGKEVSANAFTLLVASNSDFSTIIDQMSKNPATGPVDFLPTSGTSWPANSYFKITFAWNNSTTTNKGTDVTTVAFYEGTSSTPTPAATPTFSPAAGTYTSAQNVSLSSTTSGAKIYYTTNGTDPSSSSALYSSPISVSTSTTIKAIAYDSNNANPSEIATAAYTINASAPTISVAETINPFANTVMNATSAEQSYTVLGANLTGDVTVTPPAGFEISKTSGSGFVANPSTLTFTSGEIASAQNVYVRFAPTAVQAYSGNITHTSTGATQVDKAVSGTGVYAEPTDHPAGLTATANSSSQITVTWTDASGAQMPAGYIVKAAADPASPTAPVDGTAEVDATLVKNIAQGTHQAVFTGLSASTTYNFSIWPYTNSGTAINYKTDGVVPTTNATTSVLLVTGATVTLRPSYIDLSSTTSESAVLMTLTNYSSNDARFRLYNGSNQYSPWDESTDAYISSSSYGDGPKVPGTPITSTTFWILFQRGNNNSSTASYRDRLGAAYGTNPNYQTAALPSATSISSKFTLSGDFVGTQTYNNSVKHVVLAYSGATLVSASSTTLSTGAFEVVCPTGTTIDKIEIRAIDNTLIVGSTGSWSSNSSIGDLPIQTFTGTGEWTETARWNTGVVPGNTAQVVVDGAATINSNVEVAGLTINAGKSLTVNAAKQLTISGTATNNGTITIQSDANGTGTIVGNVSGAATVNQYLPGYRTWYLSSPVASATPSGMDRIKYYDETKASENWVATTTMAKGKGYLVVPVSGNNILFSGTLNSGDVSIDVSRTNGSGAKPGFNLIGNPYPSYLDWSKVNDANGSLMPTSTMWYRTKKQNQSGELVYQFWTVNGNGVGSPSGASQYIPPMQAFWVRAKASGQLQLTNDMRSHAVGEDYLLKAPAASRRTLIRLELSNGTNTDETVLYLSDNANNELDAFDAPKMSNEDAAIAEIFTRAGNEKLVINALQTLPKDTEIALGFEAGSGTSFTLRANELSNLPTDVKLILRDNVTKAETDLTDGTAVYSFGDIATSVDRFSIIFRTAGAVTGIDQPTFSGLTAYSNANNQLTVLYDGAIDAHTVVSVYNAVGQRLVTQSLKGVSTVIDGEFAPGVYVVKVNNLSRKLTIKN